MPYPLSLLGITRTHKKVNVHRRHVNELTQHMLGEDSACPSQHACFFGNAKLQKGTTVYPFFGKST